MRAINKEMIVNARFAQSVWQLVRNNGGELVSITIDNPDGGSGLLGEYGIIKEMIFECHSGKSDLELTVRFNASYTDANLETDLTFNDCQYDFERHTRISDNGVREINLYINDVVKEWRSKEFGKEEK